MSKGKSRPERHGAARGGAEQQKSPAELPELVLIPQVNVEQVWPLCNDLLERGLSASGGSEFSIDNLKALAVKGEAQLWFAWSDKLDAAMVTSISKTPNGLVCAILCLAGEGMDRWLGFLDHIEDWAKMQNVKTMRLYGRKGWARKLPDYEQRRIILDKDLQE